MDELVIADKRYISARRAAREHRYHSDYIGQLIRAGKVTGQKVGRAWYVSEDSLLQYLSDEGAASEPSVVVENITPALDTIAQPEIAEEEIVAVVETPQEEIEIIQPAPVEEIAQKIAIAHIVEEKEEMIAPPPQPVIINVRKEEEVIEKAKNISGLSYLPDEDTGLPLVAVMPDEAQVIKAPVLSPVRQTKKFSLLRPILLVVVGIAIFAVSVLAGQHLNATVGVNGSQTASVGYFWQQ